jgi:hypothetical protein
MYGICEIQEISTKFWFYYNFKGKGLLGDLFLKRRILEKQGCNSVSIVSGLRAG